VGDRKGEEAGGEESFRGRGEGRSKNKLAEIEGKA